METNTMNPSVQTQLATQAMASNPFFNTPAQRTALARERFFEQGQRPTGIVSEAVIQSWTRCLAGRLAPHQQPAFEPVSRTRGHSVMQRCRGLLLAASEEIDQLEAMLAGTPCKTVLADGEGVVVRASAAGQGAGALLDTGGRVGVYLGENNLGSTAPGITVSTGQACTVNGAEHFFGVLQELHCAAAPIRDRSGRMAGVLDLSIQGRPFAFDALSVVRLAATSIENRLFAAQSEGELLLRFQTSPALLGTPLQGLAAIDSNGRLCGLNAAAAALLQVSLSTAEPRSAEAVFGASLAELLRWTSDAAAAGRAAIWHRLPSGLRLWLQSELNERASHGANAQTAAAPSLEPPFVADQSGTAPASLRAASEQHMLDTLRQCQGNVAKAARTLGVSRGLLYRRLSLQAPR
jgi:sigma-54 dependent transcriptional regulator, acetoin dehydrogenase operon transcriptional activator AcoR